MKNMPIRILLIKEYITLLSLPLPLSTLRLQQQQQEMGARTL